MRNLLDLSKTLLRRHEGLRLRPYLCTAGKLTVGYGHNLDALGISIDIAEAMLQEDVTRATRWARRVILNFDELCVPRQAVLVDMAFNLGQAGLSGFVGTIAAIQRGDFADAARHMLDSKWAAQVGQRARTLAKIMETGEQPDVEVVIAENSETAH